MTRPLLTAACLLGLAACTPTPPADAPAAEASPATPDATAGVGETATDAAAATSWQCGDQRIAARFDKAADTVALDIEGQALALPQAVSASGARYADAQGNEFWNKGREATLTLAGKPQVHCTQVDAASPWDAAKARGIAFRAIGTEPGWLVEVGRGRTPSLHAELDYGERTLQIPQAQAAADVYTGKTADGVAVTLATKREACSDGMSDNEYPASATLVVGEKVYRGCGRFLAE